MLRIEHGRIVLRAIIRFLRAIILQLSSSCDIYMWTLRNQKADRYTTTIYFKSDNMFGSGKDNYKIGTEFSLFFEDFLRGC